MRCRPAADPLAVWTFVQAGEEIAAGNLSVADQQRAVAGRETVAERSRALLEANRRRAAERYAAGGLRDSEDVVRVWCPRDPAGLVPPMLLVGVHNAFDPANPWPDRRAQEYLPGRHRRRFDAHLRFVTGEVIPWATDQLDAAAGPWVAAGFSNGAAWAIGTP